MSGCRSKPSCNAALVSSRSSPSSADHRHLSPEGGILTASRLRRPGSPCPASAWQFAATRDPAEIAANTLTNSGDSHRASLDCGHCAPQTSSPKSDSPPASPTGFTRYSPGLTSVGRGRFGLLGWLRRSPDRDPSTPAQRDMTVANAAAVLPGSATRREGL